MTEPNMEWEKEFDEEDGKFHFVRDEGYGKGFSIQKDLKSFIRQAISEAEQRGYEKRRGGGAGEDSGCCEED